MSGTSRASSTKLVDADDDILADPVALVVAEGGLLDLVLDEVDRLHRAPELVDLGDQPRALVSISSVSASTKYDPANGSTVSAAPGLVADDLLRAQRDLGRAFGRQGKRLVEAVGMQRLGTAAAQRRSPGAPPERCCSPAAQRSASPRLSGCGSAAATSARLGAEALAHDLGPHPAGGAELRHLLEDVVVAVEEERQPRGEAVDLEAGVERGLHVGDAVGERERDLLDRGAALLTEVVAADRDRVPLRARARCSRRTDRWSGGSHPPAGR